MLPTRKVKHPLVLQTVPGIVLEEIGTHLLGPLVRKIQNAVISHVETTLLDQLPTLGTDLSDVVARQRQALQVRQFAHQFRHISVQQVVGKVEDLDLVEARERLGYRSGNQILAGVEQSDLLQLPDLVRQAAGELVVQEEDLEEVVRGVAEADAPRDRSGELVVREGQVQCGGFVDAVGDILFEIVVVEEDNLDVEFEDFGRDRAGVVVEPEVEEGEVFGLQDLLGEWSGQFVVTEVELVQEPDFVEEVDIWDRFGEVVGVGVEEG